MPLERDTRPLGPEELSPGQIETIESLNGLLAEMQVENQRVGDRWAIGGGDYATILAERSHRVILIEGDRGTGKTSLLLTLLRYWRPDTSTLAPVYPRGGSQEVATSAGAAGWRAQVKGLKDRSQEDQERLIQLFNHSGLAGQIEPLPGVDLDPKPSTMGVHALLLQGFASLVASKCHQGSRRGRRDAEWEHWGEEPEDEAPDLAGLYRLVQRDAIAAEGTVEARVDDIDLAVSQRVAKDRSWIKLRERYWAFIEALLTQLRDTEHRKLLIVSLDDLDLNPTHADDVLQAMRLLWHPQVVFLATGHYEGLVEGVHLSRLRSERAVAVLSIEDVQGKTQAERCSELARLVVEKTLPQSHVFKVSPGPNLSSLFAFATGNPDPFKMIHEAGFLPPEDGWSDRRALQLLLQRWSTLSYSYTASGTDRHHAVATQWSGLTYREFESFKRSSTSMIDTGVSGTRRARHILHKWAALSASKEVAFETGDVQVSLRGQIAKSLELVGRVNGLQPLAGPRSGFSLPIPLPLPGTDADVIQAAVDLAFSIGSKPRLMGERDISPNPTHFPLVLSLYLLPDDGLGQVTLRLEPIVRRMIVRDGAVTRIPWPRLPAVSLVFVENYSRLAAGEFRECGDCFRSLPQAFDHRVDNSTDLLASLIYLLAADRIGPSPLLRRHLGSVDYFSIDSDHMFGMDGISALVGLPPRGLPADQCRPGTLLHAIDVLISYTSPGDQVLRTWLIEQFPRFGHACFGLRENDRAALLSAWRDCLLKRETWEINVSGAWGDVHENLVKEHLINFGGRDEAVHVFSSTLAETINNRALFDLLNDEPASSDAPPIAEATESE